MILIIINGRFTHEKLIRSEKEARTRAQYGWRARIKTGSAGVDLMSNGFEFFCLVQNPNTGETWLQSSENYWAQSKMLYI